MAAIRNTLQKEVFSFCDEKILSICFVSKAYKKKKTSFLCLIVTAGSTENFILYQVKKSDKNIYKKKQSWPLADIRMIDGVNVESMDLEIHIDKIYKWSAANYQERKIFICNLFTYSYNLPQRPEFKNISREWLAEPSSRFLDNINIGYNPYEQVTPEFQANNEYEQETTGKGPENIFEVMDGCYYAYSNAELFMETIAKDLSNLDEKNIKTLLASEAEVAKLMTGIDAAISEATKIEERLIHYDEQLGLIREEMERVGKKNIAINVANRNSKLLLEHLEQIITQLNISTENQRILNEAELPEHKDLLIIAGTELLKAISSPLPLGMDKLSAVTEQKKRLDKLKAKFSLIVARHLNNLFIHLGNDSESPMSASFRSSPGTLSVLDISLSTHEGIQKELEPYTELMKLLRALDNKAFVQLTKVYTKTMGTLYQRDFKFFFEEAKDHLINRRVHQSGSSKSSSSIPSKADIEAASSPVPICFLSSDVWTCQGDGSLLDSVLDCVLSQLQPVCLAEQGFCVKFLQLDSFFPTFKTNESIKEDHANNGNNGAGAEDGNSVTSPGGTSNSKLERQVNEQVRTTMSAIFPTLETELNSFISFLDKIDSFWCMYVLVRLSQHVMSAQDTGSFLSKTFASALVQVKRSFDKYMQMQQHSISRDTKVNKRNKCGILPYVENFGSFAIIAESIFKTSDRKIDLEKWYTKLIGTMFESIVIHSTEHHKTPPEVIKMENFHHLYDLLSRLKISVLDAERKEAKHKYQDALKAYVTRYFGRPLEKLNLFFEGVQAKVGSGVKESEVSYQMAFSKQELRKVVKEYPAREVKKGLEHLYKKVEKHLCEEENLLQVVWREMQGEFIAQYKCIEELIQRCYPDSNITLEFTIQNILEFFSEIAQSH